MKLLGSTRTRLALALGALGLLAGSLAILPDAEAAVPVSSGTASAAPATSATDAVATGTAHRAAATATKKAATWKETKELTRSYYDASGAPASDKRSVTVTADKTTNLQTRERIKISWSGAHPTGGRALNPFGVNGLNQEYPVLIMECRGLDDSSLPADQQLSPDTCWTSTYTQRTTSANPDHATWLYDADSPDAVTDPADATAGVSGVDASTLDPKLCPTQEGLAYHITPYVAADGTTYDACSAESMPPSAANNAGEPSNETYAFTSADGKGSIEFEVRTKVENEALGCSQDVACSVVVIPMMGLDCSSAKAPCNGTGIYDAGSLNPDNAAVDDAVSPLYWWSPSNWNRRFTIPLSFAPPPDTCQLQSSGTPVPFYGSELLTQAALQWAPAYCLDKQRFNWQANSMPDDAATEQVINGTAVASQPAARVDGDDDLAYAPTALTGWGIAYNIDRPDGSQDTTLKLNARLLAKLLTESYPGSNWVKDLHPGLHDNPVSLNQDPEFKKLNPGLNTVMFSEAAATLMSLSTSSAIMEAITSYIKADPDAMAWINGKADPWGMKVNPAYKGISLPVSTWPLLDTWTPKKTGQACLDQNPSPYMQKIAYPVSSFSLISEAMLLSWPYVNTVCTLDTASNTWSLGRVQQEGVGRRFHLGIVTLGDAARYGLTVARLQTSPGHYVAADEAGLKAAVDLMKQPLADKPFELGQGSVRKSSTAYPGTMVVYTAAKAKGLKASAVKDVAQFIQVSTTEGQKPGRGVGELPDGYVPITDSGSTARLYAAAQTAYKAIKSQSGVPMPPTTESGTPGGNTPDGGTDDPDAGAPVTPGDVPTDTPSASAPSTSTTPTGESATTTSTVATAAVTSKVGGGLLPVLLVVGLASAIATGAVRMALRLKGFRS